MPISKTILLARCYGECAMPVVTAAELTDCLNVGLPSHDSRHLFVYAKRVTVKSALPSGSLVATSSN